MEADADVVSEDTGCDDGAEIAAADPGRGLRRVVWCILECSYVLPG